MAEELSTLKKLNIRVIQLIGLLAFNHDRNRVRLVLDGALAIIFRAMQQFPDDEILQKCSCTTLTNLSHNCGEIIMRVFVLS